MAELLRDGEVVEVNTRLVPDFDETPDTEEDRKSLLAETLFNNMDRGQNNQAYREYREQQARASYEAQQSISQEINPVLLDNTAAMALEQNHKTLSYLNKHPEEQAQDIMGMEQAGLLDNEANYYRMKELQHDFAHFDSSEQAVVDWVKIKADNFVNPENREMIDPDQALEECREQGIELKFDKPVSRSELDYTIQKAKYKQEIENDIAKYSAYGDYSAMQRVLLAGSAISGGVGAIETGVMIGTSLLGGWGAAAGLERLATLTKIPSLANGIGLAGRMMTAEKAAQTALSAEQKLKAIETAAALTEELKASGMGVKAAYDFYRAGKMASGVRGSMANVMAYFGMDSMFAEGLREYAISLGTAQHDPEHTTKKVIANILMAGAGGAVLPAIGTAGKEVLGAVGRLGNFAINSGVRKANAIVNENALKAHETLAKEAIENGDILTSKTENIMNIARGGKAELDEGPLDIDFTAPEIELTEPDIDILESRIALDETVLKPENEQVISDIANANLTDEETATVIQQEVQRLKTGTSVPDIPMRSQWYSTIPGMLDFVQDMAEKGADIKMFFKYLGSRKIKLDYTSMPEEGIKATDRLLYRLKNKVLRVGVRLQNEKGALGRFYSSGLSREDAERFLSNVYVARMAESTEKGKQAFVEAQKFIEDLALLRKQVNMIINTYERIEQVNARSLSKNKKIVFNYNSQQMMYTSAVDNSNGSLVTALRDMAQLALPEKQRTLYQRAREELARSDGQEMLLGKSELDPEAREAYLNIVADVEDYLNKFVDSLTLVEKKTSKRDGKTYEYVNLRALGKTKEQTSYLKQLSTELNEMINDNTTLLNSDIRYIKEEASPEKVLEASQKSMLSEQTPALEDMTTSVEVREMLKSDTDAGKDIPVMSGQNYELPDISLGADKGISVTPIRDAINSEGPAMGRLNNARAEYLEASDTAGFKILETVNDQLDKLGKQGLATRGYITSIFNGIENSERLLSEGFDNFSKIASENFSKVFNKDITIAKDVMTAIKDNEQGFRRVIKDTIKSSYVDTLHLGETQFARDFIDRVHDIADDFCTNLIKNKDNGIEVDKMAQPLIKEIAVALTDLQAGLFYTQSNFIKAANRMFKTPGKMNESILGEITMTWLPTEEATMSIENIMDHSMEWAGFKRQLDTILGYFDNEGRDVDVSDMMNSAVNKDPNIMTAWEYANNKDNMYDIRKAVAKRHMFLNGTMNKTEEETYQRSSNDISSRVAQAFLDSIDNMTNKMYSVGGGRRSILSLLDDNRLKNAPLNYTKDMSDSKIMNIFLLNTAENNARVPAEVKQAMARFFPVSRDTIDVKKSDLALHWFEALDLDKMFNRDSHLNISLNKLRNSFYVTPAPGAPTALENMIKKYGEDEVIKGMNTIADGFFGKDGESIGLFRQLEAGAMNPSAELASRRSRYLENMKPKLHYKSEADEAYDMRFFGYTNLKSWFDADIGKAKKAYAILSKAGGDPFAFYNGLINVARTYASTVAPARYSMKNAQKLMQSVNSETFLNRVNFAVNSVCGTYSQPASAGMRWHQALTKFLSSPMLMKAGFRSLSDYNYQNQYLIQSGLASATSLKDRARVAGKLLRALSSDKKLAQQIYVSNEIRNETLHQMLFNTPMMLEDQLVSKGKKAVSLIQQEKTFLEKVEDASKKYSDFMLNKLAFIGPMTEYNRNNAAMSVMESLAEYSSTAYADMTPQLQTMLRRHGINEYEWDNIFSKKAIQKVRDIAEPSADIAEDTAEELLFSPHTLLDLTDGEIERYLIGQGRTATKEAVDRYRNHLVDKASVLINNSADEMTSIPKARIQGALLLGADPDSWQGMLASSVFQFRSFGTAINFYQHARRLANHLDPKDPLFNNLLLSTSGFGSTAVDMLGFIVEGALIEYLLSEAISTISGNRQSLKNDVNKFLPEAFAQKSLSAIGAQLGFGQILTDGIISGLTQSRGAGGGLALSIHPTASSLLGGGRTIVQAATRAGTEGHRAQAVTAAAVQNAIGFTGINRHPFSQAAFAFLIGDHLQEWQRGTEYFNYVQRKRRNGYGPSWLQSGTDWLDSKMTNY